MGKRIFVLWSFANKHQEESLKPTLDKCKTVVHNMRKPCMLVGAHDQWCARHVLPVLLLPWRHYWTLAKLINYFQIFVQTVSLSQQHILVQVKIKRLLLGKCTPKVVQLIKVLVDRSCIAIFPVCKLVVDEIFQYP